MDKEFDVRVTVQVFGSTSHKLGSEEILRLDSVSSMARQVDGRLGDRLAAMISRCIKATEAQVQAEEAEGEEKA